jgi:hypothetical protein
MQVWFELQCRLRISGSLLIESFWVRLTSPSLMRRSHEASNPPAPEAVKNKNRSRIPLKGWKFAGWEGGLAPAQDRMPFNVEFTIQPANLHLRKVYLAHRTLNSQLETERHSILSGGKPTFPTCEILSAEWYQRSISISSQLLPRGGTDLMRPRREWRRHDQIQAALVDGFSLETVRLLARSLCDDR